MSTTESPFQVWANLVPIENAREWLAAFDADKSPCLPPSGVEGDPKLVEMREALRKRVQSEE